MRKPLRCLLAIHSWRKHFNDQSQMYRTCRLCGKNDDPGSRITAVGG